MKGTEADSLREWFASQKEFKTWRDLARYLGVDHRTLSKYKTGRKPVAILTIGLYSTRQLS